MTHQLIMVHNCGILGADDGGSINRNTSRSSYQGAQGATRRTPANQTGDDSPLPLPVMNFERESIRNPDSQALVENASGDESPLPLPVMNFEREPIRNQGAGKSVPHDEEVLELPRMY